ncbi:hypothetical protein AB4K20DRAFT_1888957 [Rhizopus microsporus]
MVIKSLFRMNEDNPNEIISAPGFDFPASLVISYHDVQNIIYSHMTKLSIKHHIDKIGVEKWIDYLKEKNYTTLFRTHNDDSFLVPWFLP